MPVRLVLTNFGPEGRNVVMIPLTYATPGEENVIQRIGGNQDVKRHLENLGFTVGGVVTLISSLSGNVIVKVKESRIALDEAMAMKVMI